MPETNSGTQTATQDTAAQAAEQKSLLRDLGEALAAQGNGDPERLAGYSKEAQAGGKDGEPDAPATEEAADKVAEPEADKAKDEPRPIDLSALPDNIRPTFEKLVKDGAIPADQAVEVNKGYLRNADYTKKRMADSEAKGKWEAEKAQKATTYAAIERLLADPVKLARFNKVMAEPEPSDQPDALDLLSMDPKEAAKAVDARGVKAAERVLTAKEREATERAEQEASRETAIVSAVTDYYDTVKESVTPDEMHEILKTEDAAWSARNVNLRQQGNPADVVDRVALRVEAFVAKKHAASLEAQVSKKQADAARSAKASSRPTARASTEPEYDLRTQEGRFKKAMADEGLENWNQVRFGNPSGPQGIV